MNMDLQTGASIDYYVRCRYTVSKGQYLSAAERFLPERIQV